MKKVIFIVLFAFLAITFLINPQKSLAQDNQACLDHCNSDLNFCIENCEAAGGSTPHCVNDVCAPNRTSCIAACGNGSGSSSNTGKIDPATVQKYCTDNGCTGNSTDAKCSVCNKYVTNGQTCSGANGTGINTAIGCIPTTFEKFVPALLRYAYALGGGIALLLMILGAFQMLTSAGNPEAVKKGREQFVAASTGLLFILLSTAILSIIGIQILDIPGFQ